MSKLLDYVEARNAHVNVRLLATIGFISGIFDSISPFHLRALDAARSICDILVVGVINDENVQKRLNRRPKYDLVYRAGALEQIQPVGRVVMLTEPINADGLVDARFIETLEPDYVFVLDKDPTTGTKRRICLPKGRVIVLQCAPLVNFGDTIRINHNQDEF